MRSLLVLVVGALAVLGAGSARAVDLGAVRARHFVVTTPDSQVVELNALLGEGRPVVVEFWASWCAPCRRLSPVYGELHARHAKDGLVVVGLSVEEPSDLPKVRAYLSRHLALYAVACAPDSVYRCFSASDGPIRVPRAFFFDHTGRLVERIDGLAMSGTEDRIRRAALLALGSAP